MAEALPLRVLAAVPTPPPFSGPEINGAQLLSAGLGPDVQLFHVRTNVHSTNADKGRITPGSLWRLAAMWCRTLLIASRHRPQVFYIFLSQNLTGFVRDAVLILTAHRFGARIVVHLKGSNLPAFRDAAPAWAQRMIEHVLRRVAIVCVEGETLRAPLRDLLPPERILVVPNVVDLGAPIAREPTPGVCTVLFMGHLSVAKGFADLVEALPKVLSSCPHVRVECAGAWLIDERNIRPPASGAAVRGGATDVRQAWDALASRYPGRVTLLGVIDGDRRRKALAHADVFVLPSHSEGLPMAMLEAMSCGLPVVVTPVGAIPDYVHDGVQGRLVSVAHPGALADALMDLASDATARMRMGSAAAALVNTTCTPEAGATALRHAFRLAVSLPL